MPDRSRQSGDQDYDREPTNVLNGRSGAAAGLNDLLGQAVRANTGEILAVNGHNGLPRC